MRRCDGVSVAAWLVATLGVAFSGAIYAQSGDGFFDREQTEGGARVRATRDNIPANSWPAACRAELLVPLQNEVRGRLAAKLDLSLPASVSYANAEVTGFRQWRADGWLHCSATVEELTPDLNEAVVAVRSAWWAAAEEQLDMLRPLLQIAMAHEQTASDAVVLVASMAPAEQRVRYLNQNLVAAELSMPQAAVAAAEIYELEQSYIRALNVLETCQHHTCESARMRISAKKTAQDEALADDLSSYF